MARKGQKDTTASVNRVKGGSSQTSAASIPTFTMSKAVNGESSRQSSAPSNLNSSLAAKENAGNTATGKKRIPKARRMKLSVTKIEPWSVAKVSFLLSIAGGIIQVICACILWGIFQAIGLFDQVSSVASASSSFGSSLGGASLFGFTQVISAVTIFSILEVLLIVVIATIFAFLYNAVSMLVGGIHITLGDD